jgi:hypothetical protein
MMRTTVTLDPDTEQLVRRLMAERSVSFKQALNDAIRAGAPVRTRQRFRTEVQSMGTPRVRLDGALQIASDLEDEELVRRLSVGG